jgi:hypothetical protein
VNGWWWARQEGETRRKRGESGMQGRKEIRRKKGREMVEEGRRGASWKVTMATKKKGARPDEKMYRQRGRILGGQEESTRRRAKVIKETERRLKKIEVTMEKKGKKKSLETDSQQSNTFNR